MAGAGRDLKIIQFQPPLSWAGMPATKSGTNSGCPSNLVLISSRDRAPTACLVRVLQCLELTAYPVPVLHWGKDKFWGVTAVSGISRKRLRNQTPTFFVPYCSIQPSKSIKGLWNLVVSVGVYLLCSCKGNRFPLPPKCISENCPLQCVLPWAQVFTLAINPSCHPQQPDRTGVMGGCSCSCSWCLDGAGWFLTYPSVSGTKLVNLPQSQQSSIFLLFLKSDYINLFMSGTNTVRNTFNSF